MPVQYNHRYESPYSKCEYPSYSKYGKKTKHENSFDSNIRAAKKQAQKEFQEVKKFAQTVIKEGRKYIHLKDDNYFSVAQLATLYLVSKSVSMQDVNTILTVAAKLVFCYAAGNVVANCARSFMKSLNTSHTQYSHPAHAPKQNDVPKDGPKTTDPMVEPIIVGEATNKNKTEKDANTNEENVKQPELNETTL